MSRWMTIIENEEARTALSKFYEQQCLSWELRYHMMDSFEHEMWEVPKRNLVQMKLSKDDFLKKLRVKITELNTLAELVSADFATTSLEEAFKMIEKMEAKGFVGLMKSCVAKENELCLKIQSSPPVSPPEAIGSPAEGDIGRKLSQYKTRAQEFDHELKNLTNLQEDFVIQYQKAETFMRNLETYSADQPLQFQLTGPNQKNGETMHLKFQNKEEMVRKIEAQRIKISDELVSKRKALLTNYQVITEDLQAIQKEILEEKLTKWKRHQQLTGNGFPLDEQEINVLHGWFERLAEVTKMIRMQIKSLSMLISQVHINTADDSDDLGSVITGLDSELTTMLYTLVARSFIVKQQPPQVLRKESRFMTKVRILASGALNNNNRPQVTATIISEDQARRLISEKDMSVLKEKPVGEILNNKGNVDYNEEGAYSVLDVNFRSMQLKTIKRAEKKGQELVLEEKFFILFRSDLDVGDQNPVPVCTISLPVVVTVHCNQEWNASATILWDNAFCERAQESFTVPDEVQWPIVAIQMNSFLEQGTGKGLTPKDVEYLGHKLFGDGNPGEYINKMITWSQFNKDKKMSNGQHTFWRWFFEVCKLTEKHLQEIWQEGLIRGFVSKQGAQDLLLTKPIGTFLLRFSDSELGGITVAWVALQNPRNPNGEREVKNLEPLTAEKRFKIKPLADFLRDLKHLLYLYPESEKDEVFGRWYTEQAEETESTTKSGYTRATLKLCIPGEKEEENELPDDLMDLTCDDLNNILAFSPEWP